mmetsp:Transcript_66350/g.167220  ORF Transcript_66350/g.167220 Transcript_66350/m.167220 type:complete len:148 (+) Transcript_66350:31-474(+)
MNSVHFKKNPNLGLKYWHEVCSKDDKQHIFHASHFARERDGSTPLSTTQAAQLGLAGLSHAVTLRPGVLELSRPVSAAATSSLSVAGRTSLATGGAGQSRSPRTPLEGAVTLRLGTGLGGPADCDSARGLPMRRLVTPSKRMPAGCV